MIEHNKVRPYWHLDAKWLVALIFIPVFALAFFLCNLYVMTTEKNAVNVSAALLSALYAPGGDQGNSQEIEQVREAIKKSPDKAFKPFPGSDIQITEQDLDQYSIKDLKGKIFKELAKNIYNFDSSDIKTSSDGKDNSLSTLGAMAIFTKDGHQFIGKIALIVSSIALVFLALLIFFSYGFGRMISPGIIFFIIGLPATILLLLLQKGAGNSSEAVDLEKLSLGQRVGAAVKVVGPQISDVLLKNYIILLLTGVVLILTGIIGRIIQRHKKKKAENHSLLD
ncbi:MAG: hypothetical protein M1324_00250 [Patescibacteria group bacterium]|nr:hypothetical protein [Patescibacteria group bacterium]